MSRFSRLPTPKLRVYLLFWAVDDAILRLFMRKDSGILLDGITCAADSPSHARPFMGVFKSQFIEHLSTFDDTCPQNGSKNDPMVPRTTLGCPHEGPCADTRSRTASAGVSPILETRNHKPDPLGPLGCDCAQHRPTPRGSSGGALVL
jgi:hypothetical protein